MVGLEFSLQRELVGPGLVQLGGGMTLQALTGGDGGDTVRLFSSAWWEGKRQQPKVTHERLMLKMRWSFFLWGQPRSGAKAQGGWVACGPRPSSWACSGQKLELESFPGPFLFKILYYFAFLLTYTLYLMHLPSFSPLRPKRGLERTYNHQAVAKQKAFRGFPGKLGNLYHYFNPIN